MKTRVASSIFAAALCFAVWGCGGGHSTATNSPVPGGTPTPGGTPSGGNPPPGGTPTPGQPSTPGEFVYVANTDSGNISGLSISGGGVSNVSGSPFSSPSVAAIAAAGHLLFAAGGNKVSVFRADSTTGAISQLNSAGLAQPAGSVAVDTSGKFVYVGGDTNPLEGFSVDQNSGALTPIPGTPFMVSGSRSPVISPDGQWICMVAPAPMANDYISCRKRDPATGTIDMTLDYPQGGNGQGIGALAFTAKGDYLIASLGGSNSVEAIPVSHFPVGGPAGNTASTGGTTANGVAVSPSGQFISVANAQSSNVSILAFSATGTFMPIAGSPFPAGKNPDSSVFTPSGKFLAVSNNGDNSVSVYAVGASGALTAVSGSPFPVGSAPGTLATIAP